MKKLRSGLQIKKSIIKLLKNNELSLRSLDIKLNTSSQTVLMHCKELEALGIVKFNRYKKNPKNGRPYTTLTLTTYGEKLRV